MITGVGNFKFSFEYPVEIFEGSLISEDVANQSTFNTPIFQVINDSLC